MRSYTVHAPPGDPPAPERFVFVKDGFSWPALFVPVLWILYYRLWLTLVAYIGAMLLIGLVDWLAGDNVATVLAVLAAILFAMEANNIRRLELGRRGWRELGSASGESLEEAELRFFSNWRGGTPGAPRRGGPWSALRSDNASQADPDAPIFGLFPEPQR